MPEIESSDGTRIAFETLGSGPVAIFVDGAMCARGAGPMREIANILSENFTVLLYDRRGRGESTDTAPWTVEREIEDIATLINSHGNSAALFGNSSGGALATLAATSTSVITHLAVFEPPYMPPHLRGAADAYTAELTAALTAKDYDAAVVAFLRRVGMPEPAIAATRNSGAWAGMTAMAPTLGYDNAVMADSSIPTTTSAITSPTLTLAGGASPDFLQWGARELAVAIDGARFELIDGQGHNVDAAAIAEHLVPFLTASD